VSTPELLEVMTINAIAPFALNRSRDGHYYMDILIIIIIIIIIITIIIIISTLILPCPLPSTAVCYPLWFHNEARKVAGKGEGKTGVRGRYTCPGSS
jgi:hypothetical protein